MIFYDRDTFKKSFEMTVGTSHCIRAEWHPKINQLLVGSGDGIVKVSFVTNTLQIFDIDGSVTINHSPDHNILYYVHVYDQVLTLICICVYNF